MLSRRDALTAVATAAASHWRESDYEWSNLEEWDEIESGHYPTGKLTPQKMWGSADTRFASLGVESEDTSKQLLKVWYSDSQGVALDSGAYGDDGLRFGQLATFTPDDARELAVAIYQAAEELERRREGQQ